MYRRKRTSFLPLNEAIVFSLEILDVQGKEVKHAQSPGRCAVLPHALCVRCTAAICKQLRLKQCASY